MSLPIVRQNDSPSFKSMCLLIRLGENMRRLLCISPTDSLISPYLLKFDRPLEIMRILRASTVLYSHQALALYACATWYSIYGMMYCTYVIHKNVCVSYQNRRIVVDARSILDIFFLRPFAWTLSLICKSTVLLVATSSISSFTTLNARYLNVFCVLLLRP